MSQTTNPDSTPQRSVELQNFLDCLARAIAKRWLRDQGSQVTPQQLARKPKRNSRSARQ